MMLNVEMDTAIIFTSRMVELAEFYRAGLQLPPLEAEGDRHLGIQIGPVYLGFDQVENQEPHGRSAITLWFRVDDLQAAFERFAALGARVHYAPVAKPWGDKLAAIFDLDGNLVGLSQRREAREERHDE